MPKYNSIDTIPAKVFFDILKTKNYQSLKPKPREKGLEEIFVSIYDEFFVKSNNPESLRYLELTKKISFINYKIALLKQSLHFYYYNKTTQKMRLDFIATVKEVYGIEIDANAEFTNEVERVLTVEIGILNNDLMFLQTEFDGMVKTSQRKDFDYFESISGLGNVLQGNSLVKENMTLATYVSLEKLAYKIVEQQKSKK